MNTEILVTAVGIAVTAAIALAAYLAAQRANVATAHASQVAVDAGAYARAKDIYEAAIAQLQQRSHELEGSVSELKEEVGRLRTQSADLSSEVSRLRGVNDELRTLNRQLQEQIKSLRLELGRITPPDGSPAAPG